MFDSGSESDASSGGEGHSGGHHGGGHHKKSKGASMVTGFIQKKAMAAAKGKQEGTATVPTQSTGQPLPAGQAPIQQQNYGPGQVPHQNGLPHQEAPGHGPVPGAAPAPAVEPAKEEKPGMLDRHISEGLSKYGGKRFADAEKNKDATKKAKKGLSMVFKKLLKMVHV